MTDFEEKQALMIHSGLTKGLTHPETIRISQELDDLLNELMKKSSNVERPNENKN
ncbi:Spo0E like sporulation regulatory protein [Planococcus massiliensis]|uniref:Spo0E like sporulation regulatory protein n=1 Tax=Planococcus massiliensis TaxID=1499687 RepID=A0A098EIB4_9BACL|nr:MULTISPECIES: aspartyl-phosphate phosphatase Spo0E family protein [Planococcus]MCJ1907786.1 aspartyl-phosphate phosphatase Spo0E family protein [Planococcus ruber]CEG21540.1 Spo0E like sporulation regulatory protein [Planococcus massiliensis]